MSLILQPNYHPLLLRGRLGANTDYTSLVGDTDWYPRWNFPSYQSHYMGDEESTQNLPFKGGMCTCRSRVFNYGVRCNCFKYQDLAQASRQGPVNPFMNPSARRTRNPVPISWLR